MDRRLLRIHAITILSATLAAVLVTSVPISFIAIRRAALTVIARRVAAVRRAIALTM